MILEQIPNLNHLIQLFSLCLALLSLPVADIRTPILAAQPQPAKHATLGVGSADLAGHLPHLKFAAHPAPPCSVEATIEEATVALEDTLATG